MFLSNLIKEVKIRIDSGLFCFSPSNAVKSILENEGWKFYYIVYNSQPVSKMCQTFVIELIKSPQGKFTFEEKKLKKKWKARCYEIAKKIFETKFLQQSKDA